MKLRKVWVAGALAAFTLGIGAEACATGSAMDSADGGTTAGTNCATLSACCMTLTPDEAAECNPALTAADDTGCVTFLATIKQAGLCVAASGSSSSSTALETNTGSAVGTSTSTAAGMDSGMSSSTGTVAASTSSATSSGPGTSTGAGSSTSTGTGTGVGGSIPTTCAKANDAIGCCGPNGKVYYCTGSGSGSSVTAKTCASGTVCGWDTAKGYYYCVATPGTAPSGDPIACE
jgi:hypothetical protein